MMDYTGLNMEEALHLMAEAGVKGQVVYTSAPPRDIRRRGAYEPVKNDEEREMRVVRVIGNTLYVSGFLTGQPKRKSDE